MALDQTVRHGIVFIPGTQADIESDRLAVKLIVGRQYYDTTNKIMGRAEYSGTNPLKPELTDAIQWEVKQSWVSTQITSAVDAEATARANADLTLQANIDSEATARANADLTLQANIDSEATARANADLTLQGNIDSEVTARTNADSTLNSKIDGETTRATNREDAIEAGFIAADSTLSTTLLAAFNTAMNVYADKDFRSFKTVSFAEGATLDMATILGANPVDGEHAVRFVGATINDEATVASVGISAPGTGDVTYGDILLVTVDGGVIVSSEKSDDITKQIWAALRSDVTALQTATTASAIRAHFEMGTFIDITAGGRISFRSSPDTNNDISTDANGNAIVNIAGKSMTAGGSAKMLNTHLVDLYSAIDNVTANLVQADNGLNIEAGKVGISGTLRKDAVIDGLFAFDVSGVSVAKLPYVEYSTYAAIRNSQGYVIGRGALSANKVVFWYDESGDPHELFVPN